MTGMMSDLKAGVFCQQNHSAFRNFVRTDVTMKHHQKEGQSTQLCVLHMTTESLGPCGIGSANPWYLHV